MIPVRLIPPQPAMKGRIGVVGRVHFLREVNEKREWASGSCLKFAGPVTLVAPGAKITCPECLGLARNRRVKPTITKVFMA